MEILTLAYYTKVMLLESEIREILTRWGATFVHFVDISDLSFQQN